MTTLELSSNYLKIGVGNRVGHVFAEYAVHADYAEYADADEKSHPHYPHTNICQKWQLFGSKMGQPGSVLILSAQNIIIVHTSWFYPSSGMKIMSPKSQNFGQEKMIFFTIDAVYAH